MLSELFLPVPKYHFLWSLPKEGGQFVFLLLSVLSSSLNWCSFAFFKDTGTCYRSPNAFREWHVCTQGPNDSGENCAGRLFLANWSKRQQPDHLPSPASEPSTHSITAFEFAWQNSELVCFALFCFVLVLVLVFSFLFSYYGCLVRSQFRLVTSHFLSHFHSHCLLLSEQLSPGPQRRRWCAHFSCFYLITFSLFVYFFPHKITADTDPTSDPKLAETGRPQVFQYTPGTPEWEKFMLSELCLAGKRLAL